MDRVALSSREIPGGRTLARLRPQQALQQGGELIGQSQRCALSRRVFDGGWNEFGSVAEDGGEVACNFEELLRGRAHRAENGLHFVENLRKRQM